MSASKRCCFKRGKCCHYFNFIARCENLQSLPELPQEMRLRYPCFRLRAPQRIVWVNKNKSAAPADCRAQMTN